MSRSILGLIGSAIGLLLVTLVSLGGVVGSPIAVHASFTGSLAVARVAHTATLLNDGRVLVAGGVDASFATLASAELFDPNTGLWTAVSSMNVARRYHMAVRLQDGRVLVAGGLNAFLGCQRGAGGSVPPSSAEIFDPSTLAWTVTGSMVVGGGNAGLLLSDGRVLAVAGGTADAELYDPSVGSWTQTAQVANHLGGLLTRLPDGRVFAVGEDSSNNPASELFDPTTNSWSPAAPPPNDHSNGTASLVGGKVLVVGTSRSGTGISDIYDPATNSWSATGNLNVPRYLHTATVLANGTVLVAGGCSPAVGGVLSSLELFDPATGQWTRVGNLSEARMSQTATLLPSGQVLFSGGLNGAQVPTASTELVDSLNLQAVPTSVPGAPGAGYGNIGDRVVTLNWSAPGDDGGAPITGYRLTTFVGAVLQSSVLVPAVGLFPQYVVTGLTDGTAYTFSVAAVNSVGTGPAAPFPGSFTPVAGYPDAPTNVVAVGLDASAQLSWTVPSDNGNAITGYAINSSPDGGFQSCPGSPCTFLHLTNGTSYTFTVVAINSMGWGPPSAPSNAVTPINTNGFPDAPTDVIALGLPNGSVTVSWTAPAANGSPITGYTINWNSFSNLSSGSVSCVGSPCSVTGLTNGTWYTFTVTATNAIGTGLAWLSSTAAPGSVPGVPTNVSATAGNAQATVTWIAPSSDGGPINGYWVNWSNGSQSCMGSPCDITGLTNGTIYTFTVTATNNVGTGPESEPSNAVTPSDVPGAPTVVSATAGYNQATLSWTVPAANGSPITGYTVNWSGGSQPCAGSPCTITGLTNETSYTFTVTATNAKGIGPTSAASNPVTPGPTAPSAPTLVSATAGIAKATLTWTAPAANGSPITGYTVSWSGGSQSCTGSPCDITGLTNGTSYTFTVTATNVEGTGPTSSASNAVTPADVPGAPTAVSATAGNTQATLTWTTPATNGSPITGYTVSWSGGSQPCTGSPCTITGLTNGIAYTFTVTATNSKGTGLASSASIAVTPANVPGAPTAVSATAGNAEATLTWTTPAANGSPITGYTARWSGGSQSCTGSPCTITGLTNGTAYTFTVTATNAVGAGPSSASSNAMTPADVPGAPTFLSATAGNTQATLTWTTPAANGSPITGYTVSWSGGSQSCTGSPCTITGLTNGTSYIFTVTATNAEGTGPTSSASIAVTPADVPGAPTLLSATGGNAEATLTWTAPAANGSSITGYIVSWSGGSQSCTGSPCTITGLTNGTSYPFTVSATNAVGTGPSSVSSNAVTPADAPGAPTFLSATAGNTQATLTWTTPAANGSPITGYTVSWSGGSQPCAGSPCAITGLTNGTSYAFKVTATNAKGTGALSEASNAVTPRPVVPGWVTNVVATGGDGQATVTWSTPADDGGSSIIGYLITPYVDGIPQLPVVVASTCCTKAITGLTNGVTYTFRVAAVNSVGAGANSELSNAVTLTAARQGANASSPAPVPQDRSTAQSSPIPPPPPR